MIEQIKSLIGRQRGDHDWDNFVHRMEIAQDPASVWLPGIGDASLVERTEGEDGYFVFRVRTWNTERFFRVTSETYSFGDVHHGEIEEVQAVPVQRMNWERVE
ncbi:hypothetical protein [Mycobacterium phage WXIN]|nr:hypothetical protein [Mycobacterium phage WXIN]